MIRYNRSITAQFDTLAYGNSSVNTPVTVRIPSTGQKATLYDESGSEIDNPVFSDEIGNYGFYIDAGVYDVIIKEGVPFPGGYTLENEPIFGPDNLIKANISVVEGQTEYPLNGYVGGSVIVIVSGSVQNEADGAYSVINTTIPATLVLTEGLQSTDTLEVYFNLYSPDALNSTSSLSVKDFGAIGDGEADDTEAFRLWAVKGGRLFIPRGLYRITGQVDFPQNTYVFGESAGAGTGGTPLSLTEEAASGASIIRVSDDFVGDHVFRFVDQTYKHTSSLVARDFKIRNDLDASESWTGNPTSTGCNAHLLTIVNGYDSYNVKNLNLLFASPDYNALRIIDDNSIGSADIGQTGYLENIVGIHSNIGGATAPALYMRHQQEVQLIGVKMIAQGFNNPDPSAEAIWLDSCRGITLLGCSVALTNNFGIRVFATDRASDGIVIDGMTYEDCRSGGLIIDGTQAIEPLTVSKVYNVNPRYQFPQPITCVMKGNPTPGKENVSSCYNEATTGQTYIELGVTSSTVRGNNIASYFNNSINTDRTNLFIGLPNGLGDPYLTTQNTAIVKDIPAQFFETADRSRKFKQSYNATTADDFGMFFQNEQSGAYWIMEEGGAFSTKSPTSGVGGQFKLISPTGNKSIRLVYAIDSSDNDNGISLINDDTNSSLNLSPQGKLTLTNGGGANTTIGMTSPNGTAYNLVVSDSGVLVVTPV